ncbi:hypothetical protein, partial [Desulfolutivibrio sp.]|uniref:hypothetical protein n=1 Tax=Desulfolutivibrio sp. TaxID=2773296 RepID=UPI002F964D82
MSPRLFRASAVLFAALIVCFPAALPAAETGSTGNNVTEMRRHVEAAWAAVEVGDPARARAEGLAAQAAWAAVRPMSKKAIVNAHPDMDARLAALPEEAARMAAARAANP